MIGLIFICMVKLTKLLCEGMQLNPLTTFQQLRHARTVLCYHASEEENFVPLDKPIHVGSLQQALSLAKNMGPNKTFFIYQLKVDIGFMPNFLFDEDPQVDPQEASYNTYAYSNRIEYPQGLHQGTNISLVLMNAKDQIQSYTLVKVVK